MLAGYGMTPMAGRMWGWLLICEPPGADGRRDRRRPPREPGRDQRDGPAPRQRRLHPADHPARRPPRVLLGAAGGARHVRVRRRPDLSADPRDGRARARRHRGPAPRVARPPPGDARRHGLHRTRGPRGDGPLPPAASRRAGRKERDRMTAVIRTEKLTKSYGTHRGIVDVDLEVAEGEIFGFLGPNGAGKTTTIRTLLDLIRPDLRPRRRLRHRVERGPGRDPPPDRLHPRRVRPVRPADRRPDDRVLRQPPRRRRPRPTATRSSSASTSTRPAGSRSTRRATSRRSGS